MSKKWILTIHSAYFQLNRRRAKTKLNLPQCQAFRPQLNRFFFSKTKKGKIKKNNFLDNIVWKFLVSFHDKVFFDWTVLYLASLWLEHANVGGRSHRSLTSSLIPKCNWCRTEMGLDSAVRDWTWHQFGCHWTPIFVCKKITVDISGE